jgi:UDPglucose 6-dehydrogenase
VKLSVIGLGKLGSPLAAVFASKGFDVVGVDVNTAFVDAINSGRAPVDEPQLQELIDLSKGRLTATLDGVDAVAQSDVTFTIVPTPSDASGKFSNDYAVRAMTTIGEGIRRKSGYHLVVMTSTVMPGSTGGVLREVLERHAGRTLGPTLGLCYNPEFIALGSVVRDMLRPDMILIGESDRMAGDMLERIYKNSCDNQPAYRRMNFVNAELTKISVNTYVTTKISYANMLADMCDRLPGADVDVVTQAVGADSRVGAKYLRGAIGYGGPCFPRDNVAFAALARSIGANAEIAEATDRVNRYQVDRVVAAVRARMDGARAIGILGLSYKPDTAVIEESQGVSVAERLLESGCTVVAYDPKALQAANAKLGGRLTPAASAEDCVRAADLVVVMTPWPEFGALNAAAFVAPERRKTVIDCWRILPAADLRIVADLVHIGRQGDTMAAATMA